MRIRITQSYPMLDLLAIILASCILIPILAIPMLLVAVLLAPIYLPVLIFTDFLLGLEYLFDRPYYFNDVYVPGWTYAGALADAWYFSDWPWIIGCVLVWVSAFWLNTLAAIRILAWLPSRAIAVAGALMLGVVPGVVLFNALKGGDAAELGLPWIVLGVIFAFVVGYSVAWFLAERAKSYLRYGL